MNNKILVTGATGNIGKNIIELLKQKNANFIAGTTNGESIDGVETVNANFADAESLEKAMQGVSTVFMVLPNHPDMVKWGENIIYSAKKAQVKHIVRSSGSLADINSDLLIEKLLGTTDKFLKESGINYTITAPNFFMQNFINFFGEDYKNGTIYQPAGDEKIGWTDIRDIAAVNVEALLSPEKYLNQTLTITGSESFNYEEAVNQMNRILGKDSKYVAVPNEAAIEAMKDINFPPFIIDLMISLNESIKQGHAVETTNTVEQVTGKKAIKFMQFVNENKSIWA
ncbi:SDR family oxidoreductase [Ancylomarina longa]|uniref:SDR family oxidoreductase n=1 Tax=Ancylomarina longa TaxID=2487017 RepID=A0A434AX45_9BACT|nr:SDR family oxidoreductase [Ancylomarina longa]RUT78977.1 SDR family oxidoreductase [Ancylomarina longa]